MSFSVNVFSFLISICVSIFCLLIVSISLSVCCSICFGTFWLMCNFSRMRFFCNIVGVIFIFRTVFLNFIDVALFFSLEIWYGISFFCLMLVGWRCEVSRRGLAIIFSCCFCSSAESLRFSKRSLMRLMLKSICVVVVVTERSLLSVVICLTLLACCVSVSVYFTFNLRKFFLLMVIICVDSLICSIGRFICVIYCLSAFNVVLLFRSKRRLVRLSTVIFFLVFSSFFFVFVSFFASAYCRVILRFFSGRFVCVRVCFVFWRAILLFC